MEKSRRAHQAGDRRRHVVAARALYRRLGRHGLQRFVTSMLVHRPTRGRSVLFSTGGNELVLDLLGRSPRFCRDGRVGGILHRGIASFREVGKAASLHVTLESGDRLSVHLDRKAPAVAAKPDGGCIYERRGAVGHIWRDVLPSLFTRHGTGMGNPRLGAAGESVPITAHAARLGSGRPSRRSIALPEPTLSRRPELVAVDTPPTGTEPLRRAPPRPHPARPAPPSARANSKRSTR